MGHQGGQVRPELRGEARRSAGDFAMVHYIPGPVWREPRRWDGSERSEDVGGREGALPLQHQKLRPPGKECWHYEQVVCRSSTRIGCTRVVCLENRGVFIYLVSAQHVIMFVRCYGQN